MNKIELNKSTCELIEEGVVYVVYKDKVDIELKDVIETRVISNQLAGGHPYVSIYESGPETIITKEAREISSKNGDIANRKALAIVVSNLAHRLIVNFFINMNKHIYPMKAFNTKEEAIKWAKQHLKTNLV